jgi:hypothetical protein
MRPSGVYLSTASGRSFESLETISSRDKPVCRDRASNTSGRPRRTIEETLKVSSCAHTDSGAELLVGGFEPRSDVNFKVDGPAIIDAVGGNGDLRPRPRTPDPASCRADFEPISAALVHQTIEGPHRLSFCLDWLGNNRITTSSIVSSSRGRMYHRWPIRLVLK